MGEVDLVVSAIYVVHRPLHIRINLCSEGGFYGTVDEMPGCGSQGETAEECLNSVEAAIDTVLQVRIEDAKGDRLIDLKGVAPDATGSEMSEDFIRRKRDEGERLREVLASYPWKWVRATHSLDDSILQEWLAKRSKALTHAALHIDTEGGGDG